jgi:hypothetical protein
MFGIIKKTEANNRRFVKITVSLGKTVEQQYSTPWANTAANRAIRKDTEMAFNVGQEKPKSKYIDAGECKYSYSEIKKYINYQYKDYPELSPTEKTLEEYIEKLEANGFMLIKTLENGSTKNKS